MVSDKPRVARPSLDLHLRCQDELLTPALRDHVRETAERCVPAGSPRMEVVVERGPLANAIRPGILVTVVQHADKGAWAATGLGGDPFHAVDRAFETFRPQHEEDRP